MNTDIPPNALESIPSRSPGRACARPGCTNLTRFKYCDALCRVQHYNERRASAPSKCGICSSSDHRTQQCDSEAAKNLPALLDVVGPRRCRGCGQTDHDSRSPRCTKRKR